LRVEDEVIFEGEESDPDSTLGIASAPPSHAKTSPSLHAPTFAKRVRRLAQALMGNTMASIAIAVAATSWLLLLLVVVFGRPAGIPPDDLMRYYQSVRSTEFDQAEKLLATYSDELPEELRDAMHADLEQRVQRAAEQLDRRARQALARGDLDAALEQAEAALEIREDDLDMLFVAAEALRRLERLVAAVRYYERFVALADEDSRLDDALFWQAEAMVSKSQLDKARALYTRILEMKASNFKTSAQRRLSEIGD
jgi:tetratricopeptide (TPR) repeat protein